MNLGPHTIIRLRGTAVTDPYSDEPDDLSWSTPATLTIPGCSVQPGPSAAVLRDDRRGVIVDFSAWVPGTPDVTEQDRVQYAGTVYQIADTIQRWGFGNLTHTVVPLKRVEG